MVSREHAADDSAPRQIAALPRLTLSDLAGKPIDAADLKDRVVLVEFWATWCPPCRSTLEWIGQLKQKYGDRLAILALAVESPEEQVRALAASLSPDLRWAITDTATAGAFGDITSVPTLFLFDSSGKTARVIYGAPPGLHEDVTRTLDALMPR